MVRNAVFLAVLFVACSPAAFAGPVPLWGIKSCDGDGRCPGAGDGSAPPANVFSVSSDGSGFVDFGPLTLGGQAIDADALAWSDAMPGSLFGFRLFHDDAGRPKDGTGSQLVRMDLGAPSAAIVVGDVLDDRDVRGAAFDALDRLWAVDARRNELLRIDAATGAVAASTAIAVAGGTLDVATGSDIAFRPDGSAFLVNGPDFYELDLAAAVATLAFSDTGFHAGAAFESAGEQLVTFEVNGSDDLFRFDPSGTRTFLTTPSFGFNAGRGDLAARVAFAPVPAPASAALLLLGVAGLLRRRRAGSGSPRRRAL